MCDSLNIDRLIASGHLAEAVMLLSETIAGAMNGEEFMAWDELARINVADLYFRRGKLYWRLGERGKAASDYARASELDPEGPAMMALEQARDVESFFNPDLYNP